MTRVALIGLGEVGTVIAEELRGLAISAWDVAFDDPHSAVSRRVETLDVAACSNTVDAVRGADLVISAVTAANAVSAAVAAAPGIEESAWFLDLNSSSPERKESAAIAIEQAGGRYVEAAVMSPIEPKRLAAPMLLGGPHAAAFAEFAAELGFTGLEPYAETIGLAAATKLCRSVVIKGLEALLTESMLAARSWGVEDRVLDSLSNLLPGDWHALAPYMISRSLEHGTRRAEEMREAAMTVSGAGVTPTMSDAVALRQEWAAQHHKAAAAAALGPMLDAMEKGPGLAPRT
jgi:3-hydroxyisobutyrate dehydrogenase-like beta-hydroxyacid dehydrogenase